MAYFSHSLAECGWCLVINDSIVFTYRMLTTFYFQSDNSKKYIWVTIYRQQVSDKSNSIIFFSSSYSLEGADKKDWGFEATLFEDIKSLGNV